jgi:hypothetical protein
MSGQGALGGRCACDALPARDALWVRRRHARSLAESFAEQQLGIGSRPSDDRRDGEGHYEEREPDVDDEGYDDHRHGASLCLVRIAVGYDSGNGV